MVGQMTPRSYLETFADRHQFFEQADPGTIPGFFLDLLIWPENPQTKWFF
jgi:hypothetical protein